jgi:hypothetical protein
VIGIEPESAQNGVSRGKHTSRRPRAWKLRQEATGPAGRSPAQCGAPADGEHDGDQVVQRPGQVALGGQGNLLIDAKMIDRRPRNRAVERRGSQGACDEFLPRAGVAGRGVSTIQRPMVPPGPIRVTTTLISSVCPLQPHSGRQAAMMAA